MEKTKNSFRGAFMLFLACLTFFLYFLADYPNPFGSAVAGGSVKNPNKQYIHLGGTEYVAIRQYRVFCGIPVWLQEIKGSDNAWFVILESAGAVRFDPKWIEIPLKKENELTGFLKRDSGEDVIFSVRKLEGHVEIVSPEEETIREALGPLISML